MATSSNVLIMGPLQPDLIERLHAQHRCHHWWEIDDKAVFLAGEGQQVQVIATSAVFGAKAEVIDALPALKAITSFGVGYDAIDLDAARRRGVQVSNTPDVLNDCVADLALALMLDVSRRVTEADRFLRNGQWLQGRFGLARKLGGKTCGIVGMGNIGKAIARRAEAFGMRIAYHGRNRQELGPWQYFAQLNDLAREADYLVLVVPGGAATNGLINAAVLEALGPQGYLINVARGSVVDQPALVEALQQGRIAGAGLDVFADEPRVPQALIEMDNVVLTPHVGSGTHETREAMAQRVLDNLAAFEASGQVLDRVV